MSPDSRLEEYVDSEAAIAHNAHCEELLGRVGRLAEMTAVQLHGEVSPEVEAWTAALPIAKTHRPIS